MSTLTLTPATITRRLRTLGIDVWKTSGKPDAYARVHLPGDTTPEQVDADLRRVRAWGIQQGYDVAADTIRKTVTLTLPEPEPADDVVDQVADRHGIDIPTVAEARDAVRVSTREELVARQVASGVSPERAEMIANARDALQANLTAAAPGIAAVLAADDEPASDEEATAARLRADAVARALSGHTAETSRAAAAELVTYRSTGGGAYELADEPGAPAPLPEYAARGDDALRIMGARGDDAALVELDRRRAVERAAWDRQYARGNKPAEPATDQPAESHDEPEPRAEMGDEPGRARCVHVSGRRRSYQCGVPADVVTADGRALCSTHDRYERHNSDSTRGPSEPTPWIRTDREYLAADAQRVAELAASVEHAETIAAAPSVVTVKVENTYACGRESSKVVELPAPPSLDDDPRGDVLAAWWDDVVEPHTGDGHPCGTRDHAIYDATITAAPGRPELVGSSWSWEG